MALVVSWCAFLTLATFHGMGATISIQYFVNVKLKMGNYGGGEIPTSIMLTFLLFLLSNQFLLLLFQSITGSFYVENRGVMKQTIQDGRRYDTVSQNLTPISK